MKKMVLGVSRGNNIDPQPHPIGWIKLPGKRSVQEEIIPAYQRLGLNPFVPFQYFNEEGQELRVVYQEFELTVHESLTEITSAKHLSNLAKRWLGQVNAQLKTPRPVGSAIVKREKQVVKKWEENMKDLENRIEEEKDPEDKADMQQSLKHSQAVKELLQGLATRDGTWMPDFNEFLGLKGIAPDDPRVPLLEEVWNQAIGLSVETMLLDTNIGWGFAIVSLVH